MEREKKSQFYRGRGRCRGPRIAKESQLQPQAESKSQANDDENLLLCSICADFVTFYAVGACDHNICSTCSLRLRTKDSDKSCPICKQMMEYVICYRANQGIQLFSSFDTMGLDTHIPGFDIDHLSSMMFAYCNDHYKRLVSLRSITCPVRGCDAADSFRSNAALLQHMKARHDVSFCPLCLESRSVFISEHTLYNPSQLKKHMTAPLAAGHGGHPACHFCVQHFYDSPALYRHMHTAHTTCHLCPSQFQHRFYRNAQSLLEHTRDLHIVCSYCTNEDILVTGVEYAFRTVSELQTHLMQVHRVSSGAGSKINLAVGFKASHREMRDRSAEDTHFLDFDWSSSDPNQGMRAADMHDDDNTASDTLQRGTRRNPFTSRTDGRGTARKGNQRANAAQESILSSASANELVSMVPSNMRIAGRVSGAGLFHYTEDDQALQAVLEEATYRQRAMISSHVRPKTADAAAFPELGQGLTSNSIGNIEPSVPVAKKVSKESAKSSAAPSQHLNSILNSVKPGPTPSKYKRMPDPIESYTPMRSETKAYVADSKVARNSVFAQALGIPTVPSIDVIVNNEEGANSFDCPEPPLEVCYMCVPSLLRGEPDEFARRWAFLDKPLFLPLLVSLTRENKDEIKKVEKKMQDLVESRGSSSSQLKPMHGSLRHAVCALARYYGLNAYEFDSDPRRYVSIVKSPESHAPALRLSTAATSSPVAAGHLVLSLPSPSPVLYVSLRDSAYAYSPLDDIEYEPSAYASTVPTHRIFLASDVLLFICKILNADRAVAKMCKVVDVKLACPTAIAVSFQDVSAALCAFRVLSAQSIVLRKVSPQEAARKGKGPAIVSMPLTDLLELLPAFNPADPLLAETLAQKIEMEAAKRDQITLDASDSHVAVVSDDSGQTNQLSNTDWLAMKTATRNNVATISKETSKPTVLDAELIANIQNEWEADAISDDTFIAEESNVVESTAMSSGKEVITTADVDVDAVGKAESSASLRNAMSNQFPTSDGTYKRLVLQPRSSDLPPPLPPMPLVKKAELKDTSTFPRPKTTKVASTTSETDNKKKPAVNKFAAFSSTGEEEDSDSDDDDEGEGFLDPYDNVSSSIVPCAEGGDSVVTDSESNSIQLSEVVHRMWTCQTCTLNNSVYVPVHQRELECDACLTVWRPLS